MSILKFLNDNIGLVTFIVGFLAIYLYVKQKKDRKRGAASLILQEIRYAEQQVRNSDHGKLGYTLSSKLLPTNNWNDNIHLFIKDLKESQIDMISQFYSQASYIDSLIIERTRQKINQQPSVPSADASQQSSGQVGISDPLEIQKQLERINQNPNLNEIITVSLLTEFSSKIEYLYNTSALEKLRKISVRKWYHLF